MQSIATTPKLETHGATIKSSASNFDILPASGLVDDKTVAIVLGCSRNTVWNKARSGELPKPLKVGTRASRWQVGTIRAYLASLTQAEAA